MYISPSVPSILSSLQYFWRHSFHHLPSPNRSRTNSRRRKLPSTSTHSHCRPSPHTHSLLLLIFFCILTRSLTPSPFILPSLPHTIPGTITSPPPGPPCHLLVTSICGQVPRGQGGWGPGGRGDANARLVYPIAVATASRTPRTRTVSPLCYRPPPPITPPLFLRLLHRPVTSSSTPFLLLFLLFRLVLTLLSSSYIVKPSGHFRNDEFSSPFFLLSSALIFLVWSSCSNPICLLWSDPILYNIISSLFLTHSAHPWFSLLWSLQPDPIR